MGPRERTQPGGADEARPGLIGRARIQAGRMILYGVHAFPLSVLWLPFVPAAGFAERRWGSSFPKVFLVLRAAYYGVVVAFFLVLHGYIPYLSTEDAVYLLVALVSASTLARGTARPGGTGRAWMGRMFALALGIGLFQVLFPPLAYAPAHRLILGLVFFAGTAVFVALVGRDALRSASTIALAVALANGGVWVRHWIFYNLLGSGAGRLIEATPGVHVIPLPPLDPIEGVLEAPTPAVSLNFLGGPLFEDCGATRILVGYLGWTTVLPAAGGDPIANLDVGSSRNVWRNCAEGTVLCGNIQFDRPNEIVEIELDSLRVRRRMPYCTERAPDTLRVDPERRRAWWVDDTGSAQAIDLDRFVCTERVPGVFIRDLAIEPETGDLIVLDSGHLKSFDLERSAYVRDLVLPAPFTLPSPLGHRLGQVLLDRKRGRVLVTDLNNGRLDVVDRAAWTLERSIPLGIGVRHFALDEKRNRLYAGNFVTGDLLVLDRDDFRVLGRAFVGRRINTLSFSEDGNRLSFTTSAGGISIDLDAFLAG